MRHFQCLSLAIASLLLAGCTTTASSPAANASAKYRPPADALPRLAQSLKAHRAAAIGVGVIRRGKVAWTGVVGEAGPGKLATSETMFNVASLAKPVTAELALRLVAAGRMSLDEPMSAHWIDPDIADDPRHRKLTPRIALSHQTGLPNWRGDYKDRKLVFAGDPGAAFTYSGEGYEYLRRFIEKKTGRAFEALMQEMVFAPIGMTGATYTARAPFAARVAMPMNKDGEYRNADLQAEGNPNAADNLFVTVEDYAKLMSAVAQGAGLNASLASERVRRQTDMPAANACKPPAKPGCPDTTDFGLGWVRYRFGAQSILSGSGMDWGEFALVYFDAATGDGMLYFVNGGNGVPVVMDAMEIFDPTSPVLAFGRAQSSPAR